ncbi:putative cytosolic protein [Enterococcus faecalis CBRD01]|nr:putative cytosolic protein [Enterococcus faecalis CBRD01]
MIIMKWSLLELNKYKEEPLVFSETLHLKEELLQRDDTLLDVSPIKVEGLLAVNKSEYLLHYTIQVTVTVPSSRSLEPVALPMQITVDEVFMTKEQMDTRDERFAAEEIILLDKPTIDLDESVEDNILLSIPIQVLTEEEQNSQEMPSGNDWEVISEEAYLESKQKAAEQTVDPRLAKLSELLSDNAEEEDNS